MLPTIQTECNQFLTESLGHPLIKVLPSNNDGFRKVKVRKKKHIDPVGAIFNETFKDDHSQIFQRSVFAYGKDSPEIYQDETVEPFYIFPIDGYRYMYAPNVKSSSEDYRKTFDLLIEATGYSGMEIFQEVLKYQYIHDKLYEALTGTSEIIVYDIPYYYAIRCSLIANYSEFLIS